MRCQLCNQKIEEQPNGVTHAGFCNKCRDKIIKNLERKE